MSDSSDANDILRRDGPDALRDNLDRAHAKARGNGADKTANSEPEPLTRQSAPRSPTRSARSATFSGRPRWL